MSDSATSDDLKNRYYLSLVVRLTLDQTGRLIQGEVLDTADTLRQRFTTLSELNEAMAAWLKQQEQAPEREDEDALTSNL